MESRTGCLSLLGSVRFTMILCFFSLAFTTSVEQAYALGSCVCHSQHGGNIDLGCKENIGHCRTACYTANPSNTVTYLEGRGGCAQEQDAGLVCSGEFRAPERGVSMELPEGYHTQRLCRSGEPGQTATKLYCSMKDDGVGYVPCSWSVDTNGSCWYMASVRMTMRTDSNNVKTYCWVFNAEDVKRKRMFFFDADFR